MAIIRIKSEVVTVEEFITEFSKCDRDFSNDAKLALYEEYSTNGDSWYESDDDYILDIKNVCCTWEEFDKEQLIESHRWMITEMGEDTEDGLIQEFMEDNNITELVGEHLEKYNEYLYQVIIDQLEDSTNIIELMDSVLVRDF